MKRKLVKLFIVFLVVGFACSGLLAESEDTGDLKNYSTYLKNQNNDDNWFIKDQQERDKKNKEDEKERSYKESKGILEYKNYSEGYGKEKIVINSMKVKYKFYTLMSEPCELFSLNWTPGNEGSELHWVKFRAKVKSNKFGEFTNMYVSFSPGVSKPGKWSWDIPASGPWGSQFKYRSGKNPKAEDIQKVFRDGFYLSDLEIVDIGVTKNKKEEEKKGLWDKLFGKNEETEVDEQNPFDEPNSENPFADNGQDPFAVATGGSSDPFAAVNNDNPFEQQEEAEELERQRLAEIKRKEAVVHTSFEDAWVILPGNYAGFQLQMNKSRLGKSGRIEFKIVYIDSQYTGQYLLYIKFTLSYPGSAEQEQWIHCFDTPSSKREDVRYFDVPVGFQENPSLNVEFYKILSYAEARKFVSSGIVSSSSEYPWGSLLYGPVMRPEKER